MATSPGYYWVNPAGEEFVTHCDVDAEGVWTLVAQEVRGAVLHTLLGSVC